MFAIFATPKLGGNRANYHARPFAGIGMEKQLLMSPVAAMAIVWRGASTSKLALARSRDAQDWDVRAVLGLSALRLSETESVPFVRVRYVEYKSSSVKAERMTWVPLAAFFLLREPDAGGDVAAAKVVPPRCALPALHYPPLHALMHGWMERLGVRDVTLQQFGQAVCVDWWLLPCAYTERDWVQDADCEDISV